MLTKNSIRIFLVMTMLSLTGFQLKAELDLDESMQLAREKVMRGFQAPSYDTNFPSQVLFSIADIGRTTKYIKQSMSLKMTRSADFQIETEATGSPIIKVQASTVIIDLNGFRLNKLDTDQHGVNLDRGVGIEIGYSKAELDADSTLSQPQNVVIRNGVISNFEIGIVVHAGVKSVKLENLTISRSPVGIVFMGQANKRITSCSIDNVRVVGDNTDNQLRLQWAKDKIEKLTGGELNGVNTGFNYGADSFMPLEYNPISDTTDALVYSGVTMRHCSNMLVNSVGVNAMGYDGLAHVVVPANDASRVEPDKTSSNVKINGATIADTATSSVVQGLVIANCSSVFIENTESSNHISAMATYGIRVKDSSSCSVKSSVFSNNEVATIQNALSAPAYDFSVALAAERTAITNASAALEAAHDVVVTLGVKTASETISADPGGFVDLALTPTINPITASTEVGNQIVAAGEAETAAQNAANTANVPNFAQDAEVLGDIADVIVAMQAYKTAIDSFTTSYDFSINQAPNPDAVVERTNVTTEKDDLEGAKNDVNVTSDVKTEAEKMTDAGGYLDLALAPFTNFETAATLVQTQIDASTTARDYADAAKAGSDPELTVDNAVIAAMDDAIAALQALKNKLYVGDNDHLLSAYKFTGNVAAENLALTNANNILKVTEEVVTAAVKAESEEITDTYVPAALAKTADPIAAVADVTAQLALAATAKTDAQTAADAAKVPNTVADAALFPLMDAVSSALQAYRTALYNLLGVGLHSRGIYLTNCDAMQLSQITCNRNQADNHVNGVLIDTGNVIEMHDIMCDHNEVDADNVGTLKGIHLKDVNTAIMREITTNYNLATESLTGIFFETVVSAELDDVSASNNVVTTGADDDAVMYGIHVKNSDSFDVRNVSCNFNKGEGVTKGMFFESTTSVELREIFTNNNQSSSADVVGIEIADGNSFLVNNMSSSYNLGKTTSHGILATNPKAFEMYVIAAEHNRLVDATGTIARGILFDTPTSILIENINCSDNRGQTMGEGLRVVNGATVSIDDGIFSINVAQQFAANETTTKSTDADVSKHASYNFPSGAAGIYLQNTKDCSLKNVFASKNKGPRAVGIYATGCDNSSWKNCTTSFQEATGAYFIDTPFNGIDVTALPVIDAQAPTLFGGAPAGGTVDLKAATAVFLTAVKNIKTDQWLLELTPNYVSDKDFASSLLLIRAAIAQFRLFSTAIGLHLHGCTNCIVENHFSSGNMSEQDSAFGFVCSGANNGHVVIGGKFAGNEAWTKSAKGAVVADKFSLAALSPFWTEMSSQVATDFSNDANFTSERSDTKLIGLRNVAFHKVKMDAGFGGDVDYELVNPIGGIGAGIILGDGAQNIEVRGADCSNNKGNCGQAYGLLQDVTSAALLQDNRLYQCDVTLLGVCFGLAEMTAQSNSIHVGNILFANKIGDYLNSNYLVPFNPDDPFDLSFPLKTGYNGDVGNFANASPYDNIEIRFVHPAPNNQYMGNDVATSVGTPEWQIDRGGGVKMFDV